MFGTNFGSICWNSSEGLAKKLMKNGKNWRKGAKTQFFEMNISSNSITMLENIILTTYDVLWAIDFIKNLKNSFKNRKKCSFLPKIMFFSLFFQFSKNIPSHPIQCFLFLIFSLSFSFSFSLSHFLPLSLSLSLSLSLLSFSHFWLSWLFAKGLSFSTVGFGQVC